MNGFQGFLKAMGTGRLIGVAVGGFVSFALIYFLMAQMGGTPMTPLLHGLSAEDSAKILIELDNQDVEYETLNGGAIIKVEEQHANRLRMQFATEGISSGSIVGYEIFDKADALGATSFVQNINRVRALEGELTRTIMSINSIESARVHLTIAKRELFQRNKESAKATVVIRSRGMAPDRNMVRAIQHIVANSVAGLSPSNVTIADENGGLLASGNEQGGAIGSNATIDEKIHSIEERTRQKVHEILSGIIPVGKTRVQVQAEVERNAISEKSQIYDPDGQVIKLSTNNEDIQENIDNKGADKTVSVASSLPGGALDEDTSEPQPQKVNKSRTTEEKISYLNSLTVRTTERQPGEIKRLSIAVIVDGNYTQNEDGTQTFAARSETELGQITQLIRGAVGYNEERGDTIIVQSMEFAAIAVADGVADAGGMMGFSSAELVELLKTFIIGIIVLLLTLLVIRPLLKAALGPAQEGQLALAGAPAAGGPAVQVGQPVQVLASPSVTNVQLAPPPDASSPHFVAPSAIDSHIDISRVEGEVQASSIKKVGEIVENHPDETVAIIRNWLHNEE